MTASFHLKSWLGPIELVFHRHPYIEVPVPSQGSERSCICVLLIMYLCAVGYVFVCCWSCICVLLVMYLCVVGHVFVCRCINFASFYYFDIWFWNCSDSEVSFVFHFTLYSFGKTTSSRPLLSIIKMQLSLVKTTQSSN